MKKVIIAAVLLAVAGSQVQIAKAGDREWAVAGKVLTGIAAVSIISHAIAEPPVYYTAAPAPYCPPPVVYQPAPVVCQPAPVYYQPAPVVCAPTPVVVYQQPVYVRPAPVVVYHRPVVVRPPPFVSVGVTFGHPDHGHFGGRW